jgi:hypothetical protein
MLPGKSGTTADKIVRSMRTKPGAIKPQASGRGRSPRQVDRVKVRECVLPPPPHNRHSQFTELDDAGAHSSQALTTP